MTSTETTDEQGAADERDVEPGAPDTTAADVKKAARRRRTPTDADKRVAGERVAKADLTTTHPEGITSESVRGPVVAPWDGSAPALIESGAYAVAGADAFYEVTPEGQRTPQTYRAWSKGALVRVDMLERLSGAGATAESAKPLPE